MRRLVSIVLLVLVALPVSALLAQVQPRPDGFFLSPDASGSWQVWRLGGGESSAQQVTSAASPSATLATTSPSPPRLSFRRNA